MATDEKRATIGLTGLATMGRNLARNIARNGHPIAVHNRTTATTTARSSWSRPGRRPTP